MSGDRRETAWEGRFLSVTTCGKWEWVSRTRGVSAAVILAVDDGHVLLVEQQRVPLATRCLELPAGLVGDDEQGEEAARAAGRELEEETGYRAGSLRELGRFFSSPGMSSEFFELVLASDLERVGKGGGVDGEDIVVHRVPIDGIPDFVDAKRAEGCAIDVRILMLLAPAYLKLSA